MSREGVEGTAVHDGAGKNISLPLAARSRPPES
jgi:hypothetical protein